MSKKSRCLVYSTVFNESRFLPKMLDSLAAQSDKDFSVLISENHSTDETYSIAVSYASAFSRFEIVRPPRHLAGIEHGPFIDGYIHQNYGDYDYVMFVGGHDVLAHNTISVLRSFADAHSGLAVVYTDTYRLSHDDVVRQSYPNSVNTLGMPRAFVPMVVLLGLQHNILSSGFIRLAASSPNMRVCCAADHLKLCEIAVLGSIAYASGGGVYLRDSPTFKEGWEYYVQKHIPADQIAKGCVYDFTMQLAWLLEILQKSCGRMATDVAHLADFRNYFLSCMQLYLLRYREIAEGFPDGKSLYQSALYQAAQNGDLDGLLEVLRSIRWHPGGVGAPLTAP